MKMKKKLLQDNIIDVADRILYVPRPDGQVLRVAYYKGKAWFLTLDIGRMVGCYLMASMIYRYIPKQYVASIRRPTMESGIAKTALDMDGMETFFSVYEPNPQFREFVDWYHEYVIPVVFGGQKMNEEKDPMAIREFRLQQTSNLGCIRCIHTADGTKLYSLADLCSALHINRSTGWTWASKSLKQGQHMIIYKVTEKRNVQMLNMEGVKLLGERFADEILQKELDSLFNMQSSSASLSSKPRLAPVAQCWDICRSKLGDLRIITDCSCRYLVMDDVAVAMGISPSHMRAWARCHLDEGKRIICRRLTPVGKACWCADADGIVAAASHFSSNQNMLAMLKDVVAEFAIYRKPAAIAKPQSVMGIEKANEKDSGSVQELLSQIAAQKQQIERLSIESAERFRKLRDMEAILHNNEDIISKLMHRNKELEDDICKYSEALCKAQTA